VAAAELAQLGVVERLGAERHPGHAGAVHGRWVVALVRPGVRLERDLGAVRDPETLANPPQEPLDVVGRDQRGRSAAEIDRRQRRPCLVTGRPERRVEGIRPQLDLDHQGVEELADAIARAACR
jgi:hypothetical protein